MPIRIFHRETNAEEEWLIVNDDGKVTHHRENSGWPMMRNGINAKETHFTVEEAKAKWPSYRKDLDVAFAKVQAQNSN